MDGRRREALERGDRGGGERLARLLQPVHRLLDVGQPRDRVVEEHRQRRHHLRQLVAERAALVLGADRDGDGRPQLHAVGAAPSRLQEVGERPGDDREHDVVDGRAERVLDQLELVEPGAHDLDPAMRAGCDVERRVGRRVERGPRHLADAGGDLAGLAERLARVRDRAERPAGDLGDRAHGAGQPARGKLGARRLGLGHPRLAAVARPVGREVEQHAGEVDARDAVDQRVVGLREQGEAAVVQALDEPQLPQRLRAIQALGEHAPGERQQRRFVTGLGQGGVADVVGEVERRVVDPQRPAGLERRDRELLAVAGDEVQARLDVGEELVEPGRLALEDREPADVHVRVRLLLREEARVDR